MQILKCITPTGVMINDCSKEQDLQPEYNHRPFPNLLPMCEFPDVAEVARWFDACKADLGWPAGWGSFDIINLLEHPKRHDPVRRPIKTYMMVSHAAYQASPWMHEAYKKAVHLSPMGLSFYIVTLAETLPMMPM